MIILVKNKEKKTTAESNETKSSQHDSAEVDYKYEVKVNTTEERQRISQEVKKELKASGMMDENGKLKLKGVSPKMLKRMKQEFVDCPVLKTKIQFIQCFTCQNFQSRVTGMVLCKGDALPSSSSRD